MSNWAWLDWANCIFAFFILLRLATQREWRPYPADVRTIDLVLCAGTAIAIALTLMMIFW